MGTSTIVSLILLAAAFIFAVMGFSNAANSRVPAELVAFYMVVSAVFFGALAVRGLRSRERLTRFLGVAAIVGTIYMLGFAIFAWVALRSIQMPF